MAIKYSRSSGSFFDTDISTSAIPVDAKEITREEHAALLSGQAAGMVITADANGMPVLTALAPCSLADAVVAAVRRIDVDADQIYTAALGNRATEYAQAEEEAQTFKDANYLGTVPAYVQAWADATRKPSQWAADDILATAAAWRTAQTAIRANRLACKEAARRAEDLATVDAAKTAWQTFATAIRQQLGLA